MAIKTSELIKEIFTVPTAPFQEHLVLNKIQNILRENKIPFFTDSKGQIIAGVSSPSALSKKRHIAFFAHTDHPGFHITKEISPSKKIKRKYTYEALWYGGFDFSKLKGAQVLICDGEGLNFTKGIVSKVDLKGDRRKGLRLEIQTTKKFLGRNHFGAFDFDGFKTKGKFIYTKAADDLAGCVMALGALLDLKKLRKPAIAVFTRAEEVGFVGCLDLILSGLVSKKTMVISLEASRTLPGALLGEGPVIRLGDASSLFESNFSLYMTKCAKDLKKKNSKYKYQKKLMDGGSCEATALSHFGYKTMGLAVPLKNYHNQGPKGPAPEVIHLDDVHNGRLLLCEVAKNLGHYDQVGKDLKSSLLKRHRSLKLKLK